MKLDTILIISAIIVAVILFVSGIVYVCVYRSGSDVIMDIVSNDPVVEAHELVVPKGDPPATLQRVWDAFNKVKPKDLNVILAYNSMREYMGKTQEPQGTWSFLVRASEMHHIQAMQANCPEGYTIKMHPTFEDIEPNYEADAIFTSGTNSLCFHAIVCGEGVYPRCTPAPQIHYDILKTGMMIETKMEDTTFKGHPVLKYADETMQTFNDDESYLPITDFSGDTWV